VLDERGVPALTVLSACGGAGAWIGAYELEREHQRHRREQEARRVAERHPAVMAAMRRIAKAIEQRRQQPGGEQLPARLSELVHEKYIELADAAAFFNGVAPGAVDDFDRLGLWKPAAERWDEYIWAVRLEGDWSAVLQRWGDSVEVMQGVRDVLERPATPSTGDKVF